MNIVVHAVLYLRGSVRGWSLAEVSRVVQEVIESKGMEDDRSADGEGGLVTVSGLYTQNPLQRSVSQLIDKKDEESWEPHFRRLDSGLVRTSLTSAFSSETWSSSSVMCLSVWRRGVCGLHQRLQHSQEGTHHVHRHQPLTFDLWPLTLDPWPLTLDPHLTSSALSPNIISELSGAVLVNSEQLWDSVDPYLEETGLYSRPKN